MISCTLHKCSINYPSAKSLTIQKDPVAIAPWAAAFEAGEELRLQEVEGRPEP